MLNLVYFADPMCTWCYGFGPQLTLLIEQETGVHPVHLDLLTGGLRAFHEPVIDADSIGALLEEWQTVQEATGLPFNDTALRSAGFVYDTEPACRAVVAVRHIDAPLALDYFHAVQRAFYGDGLNVTREDVLMETAAACGIDDAAFLEAFRSDAVREATRNDFALVQKIGVTGFPTLCVNIDSTLHLLSRGYSRAEMLQAGLVQLGSGLAQE